MDGYWILWYWDWVLGYLLPGGHSKAALLPYQFFWRIVISLFTSLIHFYKVSSVWIRFMVVLYVLFIHLVLVFFHSKEWAAMGVQRLICSYLSILFVFSEVAEVYHRAFIFSPLCNFRSFELCSCLEYVLVHCSYRFILFLFYFFIFLLFIFFLLRFCLA